MLFHVHSIIVSFADSPFNLLLNHVLFNVHQKRWLLLILRLKLLVVGFKDGIQGEILTFQKFKLVLVD